MRSSQIAAAGVGITLLGALITVTGLGQNNTDAVLIGAISTATGLIMTVLASIQESIQMTGAAIVGTVASKDFKNMLSKVIKEHKKKLEEEENNA